MNILEQTLDTLKSNITGMITGKECKETDTGAVALYKVDKDDNNIPVMKNGEQVYVTFPPTQFNLEIDWTGYGDVSKWMTQFVNPQASIRWANKVRPHGLDYMKSNQKINAVEFFVKSIGFGGDPVTRATNAVDKIDSMDDIQKLIDKAQLRLKQIKSA